MTRLIDADKLKARYQAILDRGDMFCEYDIIGMVDNAPTVEERPQGEWKIYKSPVDRYYQCSCCGKNSPDFTAYMKMSFCPNCGARMEAGS